MRLKYRWTRGLRDARRERQIIGLLMRQGPLSGRAISEATGLSTALIHTTLYALEADQILASDWQKTIRLPEDYSRFNGEYLTELWRVT